MSKPIEDWSDKMPYDGSAQQLRDMIADLQSQLADCQREKGAAKQDHVDACITISAMHAAATGKPGEGPVRGVIEDVADLRAERDKLLGLLREVQGRIMRPQHNPGCSLFTALTTRHCSCGAEPFIRTMAALQERIQAALAPKPLHRLNSNL